jgi:hypothetical protein
MVGLARTRRTIGDRLDLRRRGRTLKVPRAATALTQPGCKARLIVGYNHRRPRSRARRGGEHATGSSAAPRLGHGAAEDTRVWEGAGRMSTNEGALTRG